MLLHDLANKGVDFLQVVVDLPVGTRKVLQDVVEKLEHLWERRGCEFVLELSCGSQGGELSGALTPGVEEGISSPCVSVALCHHLSLTDSKFPLICPSPIFLLLHLPHHPHIL